MARPLGTVGGPVGIAAVEGARGTETALSPDGRWLAYWRGRVFVRAFPAGETTWQISSGRRPHWSRSGRELLFRTGASNWEMTSVEVRPDSTFVRGPPTVLFSWRGFGLISWDVAPDGQRFIFTRPASPRNFVVVENFFELLKAKVGN